MTNQKELTIVPGELPTEHAFTLKNNRNGLLLRWERKPKPDGVLFFRTQSLADEFLHTVIKPVLGCDWKIWKVKRLSPVEVRNMWLQDGGIYERRDDGKDCYYGTPFVPSKEQILPNPIFHQVLTPGLEDRIARLFERFGPGPLLGSSVAEAIDIFKREVYPEKEVGIYETIINDAEAYLKDHPEQNRLAIINFYLGVSLQEAPARPVTTDELKAAVLPHRWN